MIKTCLRGGRKYDSQMIVCFKNGIGVTEILQIFSQQSIYYYFINIYVHNESQRNCIKIFFRLFP